MDKTDAGAISSSRQTQESSVRTQELCEKGVGPGLSFLSLLPPSLISHTVSVDVQHREISKKTATYSRSEHLFPAPWKEGCRKPVLGVLNSPWQGRCLCTGSVAIKGGIKQRRKLA